MKFRTNSVTDTGNVTTSETLSSFKRRLKTHLFVSVIILTFPVCVHRILFCCSICKVFLK